MTAFSPGQSPPPVRTPIRIGAESYVLAAVDDGVTWQAFTGCAHRSLHRAGQRDRRPPGRDDRRRGRRADDADADPALWGQALSGDLERSRRGGADAAVRRRRAPASRNREPRPRALDGARI